MAHCTKSENIVKIAHIFNQKIVILFSGCFMCFIILCLYIAQPYFITQIDRQIYDSYLRATGGGEPSPTPAIIDIDEESLLTYGQWPWPRHKIARLLKIVTESGVAAIGLDIMFAEPDRTSPIILQKSLQESFGVELTFSGLPQILEDNDKFFATILQSTPSVLGSYIQFSKVPVDTNTGEIYIQIKEKNNQINPFNEQESDAHSALDFSLQEQMLGAHTSGRLITHELPKNFPRYEGIMERIPENAIDPITHIGNGTGIVLPLQELINSAPIAFLNVAPDSDGIIRSIPLVMIVDDRLFLSIGLRTLMRGLGTKNIVLESDIYGLCALHIQKYRIPVSPNGIFYIPYRGPRGIYPYYSAKDILEGRIPPEELQGRVVFLGTSASGLFDIRATPFDSIYPGVESHATVVDAILSDRSISLPVWTPVAQVISIILTGLLATILFGFAPASIYLPLFICMTGGTIWISWFLFTKELFLSPHYNLLTLLSTLILLLGIRFIYEVRQKSQLRKAFTRYVSPEMVNRITTSGEVILSGEEREVSLIFTDIRGFTTFSEKLHPSKVVEVLNRYFTPMTKLVQSTNGTVDKFIGDAIMAFWNAPLDVENHELKAVRTALAMHKELENLNLALKEELGVCLSMGAGVHTGMAYVGNMGSEELLDYTCIGDNVNLCSRLEGMCTYYGVGTVISGSTAERCKALLYQEKVKLSPQEHANIKLLPHLHFHKNLDTKDNLSYEDLTSLEFILLDRARVKGRIEPVSLYIPMSTKEYLLRQEEIQLYIKARKEYAQANFEKAEELFKTLSQDFQEVKLYKIYMNRCHTFKQKFLDHTQQNTVDQDSLTWTNSWTDVWNFVTK